MKYVIPSDAAEAFLQSSNRSNAGLVFDRFAPDTSKDVQYPRGYKPKEDGLKRVVESLRDRDLREAALQRWRAMVQAANGTPFILKTEWRFVSGVGRNTPFEVGFRFDRYGFAALPGSSVKGIARAYAYAIGEDNSSEFAEIFGTAPAGKNDEQAGKMGRAIFFDAMPADDPKLVLDVMNPHYPDYYSGKTSYPTNWQSPVPIPFLTVAAGVPFEFAIGWRGERDETLQTKAQEWLVGGLTELGAGAKTNAGYGYFAEVGDSMSVTPARSNTGVIAMPGPAKSMEPPMGSLKPSEGKLERKRSRDGEQIFVNDRDFKLPVTKKRLGPSYNSLPGDGAPITYQYDEVNGERRVWHITKKSNLKGLQ